MHQIALASYLYVKKKNSCNCYFHKVEKMVGTYGYSVPTDF